MNQNKWPSMSEVGAVTLVLGVLSIAMVPTLSRAFQQSEEDSKTCLTNVKMLGLGLMQYVQDYDLAFPATYKGAPQSWAGRLQPYLKSTSVLKCPIDPTNDDDTLASPATALSYGLNSDLSTDPPNPLYSITLAHLDTPERSVSFFEVSGAKVQSSLADEGTRGYWHRPASMMLSPSGNGLGDGPGWGWRGPGQSPITYQFTRHDGGSSVGLCDGHAHWFQPSDMSMGKNASKSTSAPNPAKGTAAGTQVQGYRATFSIY